MGASERALRTLSAGNHTLLHAVDERQLLHDMCHIIVEVGGYRMAWVGYAEHDERRTIRPMAHAGREEGLLDTEELTWATTESGQTTGATAIRTGKPCVNRNIVSAPEIGPRWREQALKRGFASVSSFPLHIDGEVLGVLSIFAPEPNAFDEAEVALLGEMAADLAFGIRTLRGRAEHALAEERLKRVDRALKTLSAGNRTLLRATDEQELLKDMCQVIVEVGGYRMAWVGYAQQDEQKTIRPMAYAGFEEGYLASHHRTWADTQDATFASGNAIRTGKPVVGRDILTAANVSPNRREEALKRGYASVSAFPVSVNGKVLGNLTIIASEPDAFDEAEVNLLGELADDLAFGIATLRMRARHEQAEETIRRMAYQNALTGLPNRTRLEERLAAAIAGAKAQHRSLALLTLNVDRFREINEVIGFRQGDRLLQEMGPRLQKVLAEGEMLAHLGVDEFAVLLPRADVEYASEKARRILKALDEPFEVSGIRVEVRASIGIALFPGHGTEPDLLILRADSAMYQAKRAHCGFALFKGDTEQENLRRLALIGDLRRAIDEGQLLLYCQPKADLHTGSICGAEALVRWRHPEHGMIAPDRFVPLAESTGLIQPLTYWVLNAALGQCYEWREAGLAVPLAVNLSARNLHDPRLLERIGGLLTTWGASPDWLQVELTESALMEDPAAALDVLRRLSKMGIKLFVDDFGTGYSSLSYLQELPIDAVKIDKSFVLDMTRNEESLVIVRSTIDLAHNLGLEVVAEGTESKEIQDQLVALGCDMAQGSYVGPPMASERFLEWQRQAAADNAA